MADDMHQSEPLLRHPHEEQHEGHTSRAAQHVTTLRATGRRWLDTRRKHFIVMAIVALDVVALLANVFIQLIACEMDQTDEPWVQPVTRGLESIGLAISTLFLFELAACLFSFGFAYLSSWFHLFDSAVIVISFVIDIASQGLAESIGSLVVILRLWRLAKISEELVLGASERMDVLEQQMEELGRENRELRAQLGRDPQHQPVRE